MKFRKILTMEMEVVFMWTVQTVLTFLITNSIRKALCF
jgi:hypothetical protein